MQLEIYSGPYEPSLSPALIEDVVFPSRDLADGERDEPPPTLLVDELNHRIRNVLTMVQAIVNRTQATSVEDYRARLIARISGLGNVHQLIGLAKGQSIRLTELLRRTLSPGKTDDRFDLAGPDVSLDPTLSLALHLVFHELATNASKHGALSSPLGWVKTRWKLTHLPGGRLMLVVLWTEHGGPPVKPPDHEGFGSRLFANALARQGQIELNFRPEGVACRMSVALDKPRAIFGTSN